MIPYVYYIQCMPTGQKYIGCKYGKKTADPETFWKDYYTSSSAVHRLIEEYGADAFNVSIRKVFETVEECQDYETRLLTRLNVKKRKDFLNRHNNDWSHVDRKTARRSAPPKMWITDGTKDRMINISETVPAGWNLGRTTGKSYGKRNEEFREKMREIRLRQPPPSAETRALWSQQRAGVPRGPMSEETKNKLRKPKSTTENMKGPKQTIKCPHCDLVGSVSNMKRWHFDNCKEIKK